MPRRTVVVTAGGSGIGLAIARAFVAEGDHVIIVDIDQSAIEAARQAEPALVGHVLDVGVPKAVAATFAALERDGASADILVNNAGVGGPACPIETTPPDAFEATLRVNLTGAMLCTKAVVPAMKARGGGVLVHVSTTSVKTGLPERTAYVVSKAALEAMSHTLARELGPHNIRSNVVRPGRVRNPRGLALTQRIAEAQGRPFEAVEAERLATVSMRTRVDPEDVAQMAVLLASDRCARVSGQCIAVDGNVEWE